MISWLKFYFLGFFHDGYGKQAEARSALNLALSLALAFLFLCSGITAGYAASFGTHYKNAEGFRSFLYDSFAADNAQSIGLSLTDGKLSAQIDGAESVNTFKNTDQTDTDGYRLIVDTRPAQTTFDDFVLTCKNANGEEISYEDYRKLPEQDKRNSTVTITYTGNALDVSAKHSQYIAYLDKISIEADAEMLAMVVDGLKRAGLTEFQVNIGHVNFIRGLMVAAGFTEVLAEEIFTLINNRNYFGVEEILDQEDVSEEIKEAFSALPELMGGAEVLSEAARLAPTPEAKAAIARLLKIYQVLIHYGVEKHISFDLSMSGSYMYYTGIIFRAYTYGTGDAVVRGGRYDHLLEKFGKRTPSIGFAMIVDELTSALSRQKITIETKHNNLIVYTESTLRWAISLAKEFRSKGHYTELLKREASDEKAKFMEYGKRTQAVSMLYLLEDRIIEMVDFKTGKEKKVRAGR